jgi:hypothetical protein
MKKYRFIFNKQTLLVLMLSLLCSFICLRYQIGLGIDFIFLGLFIAFPLTFSLREAFRRRERALQYLSTFSASLQSSFYHFQNSKQEPGKKHEFKNILITTSAMLMKYLSSKSGDASAVQTASDAVFIFIRSNRGDLKAGFSEKLASFQYRINESIHFLLATKRHNTPWAVRAIVLFAVYAFVIFYPASLLNETGFDVALWYVFAMTAFKGFILISLCNVQTLLEDPFNQESPDAIKLNDFELGQLINNYPDTEVAISKNKHAEDDDEEE